MYTFSQTIAGLERRGDSFTASPGEEWLQGRTLYGGLSAALAVEAAVQAFPGLPPLRSVQAAYVGPCAGPISVTPTILRAGRSATFVSSNVTTADGTATQSILCFAAHRPSALSYEKLPFPKVPPPEQCPFFFDPALAPRSAQQFDGRLAGGSAAVSGAAVPEIVLWMRHRDQTAPNTATSLVALGDTPPPSAFTMFTGRAPISTMTWSFEIFVDSFEGPGWHLGRSLGEVVGRGYCSQSMTMWSADGRPVAAGRQLVAIYH